MPFWEGDHRPIPSGGKTREIQIWNPWTSLQRAPWKDGTHPTGRHLLNNKEFLMSTPGEILGTRVGHSCHPGYHPASTSCFTICITFSSVPDPVSCIPGGFVQVIPMGKMLPVKKSTYPEDGTKPGRGRKHAVVCFHFLSILVQHTVGKSPQA